MERAIVAQFFFFNEIICHGVINNDLLILYNDNVFILMKVKSEREKS